MLYACIILLKDVKIVKRKYYKHFLLFSCAMRMLLRDNTSDDELVECQQMIRHFVRKCKNFYGAGFMSYNVHSLLHLTLDYKMYGSLDKISSFSFESFWGY